MLLLKTSFVLRQALVYCAPRQAVQLLHGPMGRTTWATVPRAGPARPRCTEQVAPPSCAHVLLAPTRAHTHTYNPHFSSPLHCAMCSPGALGCAAPGAGDPGCSIIQRNREQQLARSPGTPLTPCAHQLDNPVPRDSMVSVWKGTAV